MPWWLTQIEVDYCVAIASSNPKKPRNFWQVSK
jgi:hypothetical protein